MSNGTLRYLSLADVVAASAELDLVAVVAEALRHHGMGRTTLPEEAYLPWHTTTGEYARSIALPGAVWGDRPALGIKVINSSLANPARGIPRAQGLTMVFDRERAHPVGIMESAYLSAARTAAYTVLSARTLAMADPRRIGVIGCGPLGRQHVDMLSREYPLAEFVLHDRVRERADELAAQVVAAGRAASAVDTARAAVEGAEIVVTATTTTESYLPYEWLSPGCLVAHVSLDDVTADVALRADLLVVDDWGLISADHRRLLGRMYREGTLVDPDGHPCPDAAPRSDARRVDASLADILVGNRPGRTDPRQIILSNPFGMGILDVALADAAHRHACERGIGTLLPQ